jgi:hypothetical protein
MIKLSPAPSYGALLEITFPQGDTIPEFPQLWKTSTSSVFLAQAQAAKKV